MKPQTATTLPALRHELTSLESDLVDLNLLLQSTQTQTLEAVQALERKQEELAHVSARLEAAEEKSRLLQSGVDVSSNASSPAPDISLEDAIFHTQVKLNQLHVLLHAQNTAPSRKLTSEDEENLKKGFASVEVLFNGEACRFGVSRLTTFRTLKEEACAEWSIAHKDNVELRSVDKDQDVFPDNESCFFVKQVRLHFVLSTIKPEQQMLPPPPPPPASLTPKEPEQYPKTNEPSTEVSLSAAEQQQQVTTRRGDEPRAVQIQRVQKRAWEADVLDVNKNTRGGITRRLEPGGGAVVRNPSCAWITCWLVVLCLCLATVCFRFTPSESYSSSTALSLAINQPFSTFNRQRRFDTMLYMSEVSDWYQQILTPLLSRFQASLLNPIQIVMSPCPNATYPPSNLLSETTLGSLGVMYPEACELPLTVPFSTLISSNTTLLVFQLILLNGNMGWIEAVAMVVELDSLSQLLVPSVPIDILPLSVYASNYNEAMQPLLITSDVLLLLFVFQQSVVNRKREFWTVFGWLLLACVLVQLALGLSFEFSVSPAISRSSLVFGMSIFEAYLAMSCVSLFLLCVWGWKELRFDFRTHLLYLTIRRVWRRNGGAWLFFFVLLSAAFGLWANLAFGPLLREWNTVESCLALLLGLTFGAPVNFRALASVQFTLLWMTLFFLMWILIVFLLVMPLCVLGFMDAFLEVRFTAHAQEKEAQERTLFAQLLCQPLDWIHKRRRRQEESPVMVQQ